MSISASAASHHADGFARICNPLDGDCPVPDPVYGGGHGAER